MRNKPSYLIASFIYSSFFLGVFFLDVPPAQALATWIGSWDYVLRHDPDGKPQAAFARLRGEDDSLLWLTCTRLSTSPDDPDAVSMTVAVSRKTYLGQSAPRGRSTVYWFDDGSPELSYWVYRDRAGQLANAEQVGAFLERLSRARSLVIELSNYRLEAQRSEFLFDVEDTIAIAERFRKDCRAIAGQVGVKTSMIR